MIENCSNVIEHIEQVLKTCLGDTIVVLVLVKEQTK